MLYLRRVEDAFRRPSAAAPLDSAFSPDVKAFLPQRLMPYFWASSKFTAEAVLLPVHPH